MSNKLITSVGAGLIAFNSMAFGFNDRSKGHETLTTPIPETACRVVVGGEESSKCIVSPGGLVVVPSDLFKIPNASSTGYMPVAVSTDFPLTGFYRVINSKSELRCMGDNVAILDMSRYLGPNHSLDLYGNNGIVSYDADGLRNSPSADSRFLRNPNGRLIGVNFSNSNGAGLFMSFEDIRKTLYDCK